MLSNRAIRFVMLLALSVGLWPFFSYAVPAPMQIPRSDAVLFTRADIVLHPTNMPARAGEVAIIRPALAYNIEVRSQDALQLEYIHTLNTLTDTTGVMITFDMPDTTPLPAMKVYTPVDVLFLAADGTVLEIFPGAILGNLTKKIAAKDPAKAFLFLKNGQAAAHGMKPRDTVTGNMFSAPVSIQE